MKDIAIPYSNLQNTVILWHGTYLLSPGCPLRTTHYSTYSHYSWYTRGSHVIHLHGWHGTLLICDVVCSYMWRDSFVCVTLVHMNLIHMNEVFIWMRYLYEWGIHIRAVAHIWINHRHTHTLTHMNASRYKFEGGIYMMHMYDVTQLYVWHVTHLKHFKSRHTFEWGIHTNSLSVWESLTHINASIRMVYPYVNHMTKSSTYIPLTRMNESRHTFEWGIRMFHIWPVTCSYVCHLSI